MKALACLFACLAPFAAFGQETTLRFTATDTAPVFRISSIIVETSGLSLGSDVTEVMKKMELLTIPPSSVTVPNGDLLLNWGGTLEFNRTFAVHADGRTLDIQLIGSRAAAAWSSYALGFGVLSALVTTPYAFRDETYGLIGPAVSGAVALGGLVGLVVFIPRVEIHQATR